MKVQAISPVVKAYMASGTVAMDNNPNQYPGTEHQPLSYRKKIGNRPPTFSGISQIAAGPQRQNPPVRA